MGGSAIVKLFLEASVSEPNCDVVEWVMVKIPPIENGGEGIGVWKKTEKGKINRHLLAANS